MAVVLVTVATEGGTKLVPVDVNLFPTGTLAQRPEGTLQGEFFFVVDDSFTPTLSALFVWKGSEWVRTSGGGGLTTDPITDPTETTKPTDEVMEDMALLPGAGNYFVSFGTDMEQSGANDDIITSIYVGGVQVPGSEMTWRRGGVPANVKSFHGYSLFPVTVTVDTDAVEIRWRVGGGTGKVGNRYMSLLAR
jgi:hypothetical protein